MVSVAYYKPRRKPKEWSFVVKICAPSAVKMIGLILIAFTTGAVTGLICPLQVLAVVELALIAGFGYLCLFKF